MKTKCAVIEKFNEGPEIRDFEISPLKDTEILVKIEAAGVCGSDLHMYRGEDPRLKLPMIPGHEGIGRVAEIKGHVYDINGEKIKVSDRLIWDRGIVCGNCYYCTVAKKPFLCKNRKVYGISFSVEDKPFPNGCYSEYIKLAPQTKIIKIKQKMEHPEVMVTASCSGATSYHGVEEADIKGNEVVLIQGPGPLGLFTAAFCKEKGIKTIILTGSSKSKQRMELAKKFGATHLIYRDITKFSKQKEIIENLSEGRGADIIFETSGSIKAVETGQHFLAPAGKYIIEGIAVPSGKTGIELFENLVRKNSSFKGIWVSDTSHLYNTVNFMLNGKYPFEKIINAKFKLEDAGKAINSVNDRNILKSVILP
jgi:threonine dehydrogenase-like Zn-dependent dehydrogenase